MSYDNTIDNIQNEFLEKQNEFFRNCYKNGTLTREEYATYKKLENIVALTQFSCFATPFIVLFIIGMIIGFPLLGAFGIFFAFFSERFEFIGVCSGESALRKLNINR